MAAANMLSLNEDAKQEETRLNDNDFVSKREEEDSLRRYEAAEWLRKKVGLVNSKDLPAQPSEHDFRLGLRSGIMLCTALRKVQPGTISKPLNAPSDIGVVSDGGTLIAYQHLENLKNFLSAVEELGLPTFEPSDLEQGGQTSRVVNCVLALQAVYDKKHGSGKPPGGGKPNGRRNSEPFIPSISRSSSISERSVDSSYCDLDCNDMSDRRSHVSMMIHTLLVDRDPDEIPRYAEYIINKIMEEFDHRLENQTFSVKTTTETMSVLGSPTESPKAETCARNVTSAESSKAENQSTESQSRNVTDMELPKEKAQKQNVFYKELPKAKTQNKNHTASEPARETKQFSEEKMSQRYIPREKVESQLQKQKKVVEKQNSHIQELKLNVHATNESLNLLQTKYREEFAFLGKQLHSLASTATGYKKVLEENRKLYNQIQDLKGNIRVYCRVRPFLPGQKSGSTTVDHIEEGKITVLTPSKNGKDARKSFTFNKVFGPKATQAEVYKDIQPLVRSVLDGYNVCIFAYGQTGAGKTFTMTGPNNATEETYGVNYRALNDLFLIAEQRKETIVYEVSVEMVEIYNEQVRDLLTPDGSIKILEIHNQSQNGINVPDANRLPVFTTTDVINLMNLGHNNREASSIAMNERNSRSHSCMTVHVQGKNLASRGIIRGCMHLVDLAGSERIDESAVTGDKLEEAQHINKSLVALGDVISALASKSNRVPYKNSKLTQLLQNSLGGQAKTLMFIHMSPEVDAIGETMSTLNFAERIVELGAARSNNNSGGGDVRDLKEQIARLKAALARKDDEIEQLSISLCNASDTMSVKSASTASSPLHPIRQSTKDASPGHRRSLPNDASNKAKAGSTQKPRRGGLEAKDVVTNEADCPPVGVVKGGEKTNKSSDMYSDDNQDCEELDMANSDSESDVQVNMPRVSSLSNIKKPQARAPTKTKSPEKKRSIPTTPSRKVANGASSPAAKKAVSNVKRKTGSAK